MEWKANYGSIGAPWSVQVTPKYIYSGDGTGKIYRLDHQTGKLLGWIQSGMNQGQTGCIIHELHAVSDNVLIKGSCSGVERREDHVQELIGSRSRRERKGPAIAGPFLVVHELWRKRRTADDHSVPDRAAL